jgi:hypothetical protein
MLKSLILGIINSLLKFTKKQSLINIILNLVKQRLIKYYKLD